jgi:hypothetical protein
LIELRNYFITLLMLPTGSEKPVETTKFKDRESVAVGVENPFLIAWPLDPPLKSVGPIIG